MSAAVFSIKETVDFIAVGSGAAGGVVAKELSAAGFSVVVLEQGPHFKEKDFKHDEFSILFQSALTNSAKTQPVTFRETDSEKAQVRDAVNYCRMVGGGSVHFTANYWRFHEVDFAERSRWGELPGATLADWPITYNDLEPYYTKAEYDLGVSGQAGTSPFDPPRSKPYPMPPLPVKSSGVIFERATRKMGLHPFPAPMAILSQPYRGRIPCQHCGFCNSFGCEYGSKSSTLAALVPAALKSGHCEIRAEGYARKVEIGPDGRVTGVIYFDKQRKEVFQRSRTVVLCANGAETPRLLLMSASSRFPNGLANSSGLVGKNLMFDNGALACGVFEHPLNEHKSVQVTRLIHDYYDSDPKRGFFGGGGIDARSQAIPSHLRSMACRWMRRAGRGLQEDAGGLFSAHDDAAFPHHLPAAGNEQRHARSGGEGRLGTARHSGDFRDASGRPEDAFLLREADAGNPGGGEAQARMVLSSRIRFTAFAAPDGYLPHG